MKPEDELIDALLKEQARERDADEKLLAAIEDALDEDGSPKRKPSPWRRALPLSLAAAVAIGAAVIYYERPDFAPRMAMHEEGSQRNETRVGDVPDRDASEPARRKMELNTTSAPPPAPAAAAAPLVARETEPADAAIAMAAPPAEEPTPTARALAEVRPETDADRAADERIAQEQKGLDAAIVGDSSTDPAEEVRLARELLDRLNKDTAPTAAGENLASLDALAESAADAAAMPTDDEAVAARPLARPAPGTAVSSRGVESTDAARRFRVPASSAAKSIPAEERGGRVEGVNGVGFGDFARESYAPLVDQPWKTPWQEPLSTFSIDVDTAAYTNLRRMIREGRTIQPDAVRIEECINYFDYRYPAPGMDNPFAVHSLLATCPWKPEHLLARVAVKGREIDRNARPASNLVFLIDVSGSMQSPDKLPLLKRSMQVLIDSLDERDRVGIVVYAGTEGVVLPPTLLDEAGKAKAGSAIAKLESGGSTNGGAGLVRAYQMALDHKVSEGVNRVILATDGDFNVGTTGQGQLVELVKRRAAKGVSLSVLGFGTGNLNDAMLESITNDGNGNYFYVDGDNEAKRVFLQKLTGTLVTIAKDVKIQVEFNPGKVKAYRLIGYANRVLRNQDFNDDKVDAGDIGAGHTVTAFYEIVPIGVDGPDTGEVDGLRYQKPEQRTELVPSDDWFTLKLRYKHPEGDKSSLIEAPLKGQPAKWEDAGLDYRMASAVALFGMKLRNLPEVSDIGWERVEEIARPALADDLDERRAEFLDLVGKLRGDIPRPARPRMLEAPLER